MVGSIKRRSQRLLLELCYVDPRPGIAVGRGPGGLGQPRTRGSANRRRRPSDAGDRRLGARIRLGEGAYYIYLYFHENKTRRGRSSDGVRPSGTTRMARECGDRPQRAGRRRPMDARRDPPGLAAPQPRALEPAGDDGVGIERTSRRLATKAFRPRCPRERTPSGSRGMGRPLRVSRAEIPPLLGVHRVARVCRSNPAIR